MKDSDIEWIREMPISWNSAKLKYFCIINSGNFIPNNDYDDEGEYPVIGGNGINGYCNKVNIKNCLVIGRVGALCGNVHLVDKESWVTDNALTVIASEDIINNKYLYYILKAYDLNRIANRSAQPLITGTQVGNIEIPIINKYIQQQIINFLDKKCNDIDFVIKSKETTNEKLKEYRQSIIYEAVTKGLDKNAPMKDSGIEWIGLIPQSWSIVRLKHSSILKGRIGWQGLKANEFITEGPFLITGTNFSNGIIDWDSCVHITDERFDEAPDIHISENDLLITKDGTIGKVALAVNCPDKVSLNSGVFVIKNNGNINYINKYLYYILLSDIFWTWFRKSQNGNSTIIHLYQEQFYNFIYPVPATLTEQLEIVKFLDKKCADIDAVISANEKTIEKLKEYRQSIIYEAVTGKTEIV